MRQQYVADRLHQDGYVLFHGWRRTESTINIVKSIGSVIDVSTLLPSGDIPTVQTLRPHRKLDSSQNRYSGTYGLDEFPFHTDLAHWARPPRYLMLRCQKGSQDVATKLLACSTVVSALGSTVLHRALVRQRHVPTGEVLCILPLLFSIKGVSGIRWDPLFLVPMNKAAGQVAKAMKNHIWSKAEIVWLNLAEHGDTLILDNWRFLHGRSKVPIEDTDRLLERVYLSEIYA